jgi:hypothetical protein
VLIAMGTPYAASAGDAGPVCAHPQARATTSAIATPTAPCRDRPALRLGARNVQYDLELQ